ncbi:outer membrane beta-barrel protein [candidate division CSSED10-310 bacterium]|uniref:Outer membrane beta-barrel protein n=1 Tax=candidate division CSSED10-310 bacterium TaxID=2855610 RepID=A0ABV6YXU4_UNCC1
MRQWFCIATIICGLTIMWAAPVSALDQRFGFHLGTCLYEDDLGNIYDENAGAIGFFYTFRFIPFMGLNVQYDLFTVATGKIVIYDEQGRYLDRVDTDLRGGIFSLTPTFFMRYRPQQIFVPQVGLGLSFFGGEQDFEKSSYSTMSSNDFSGIGFNLSAGFDIDFHPRFGLHFETRHHYLSMEIEEGNHDSDDEINRIAQYYGGFYFRFSGLY